MQILFFFTLFILALSAVTTIMVVRRSISLATDIFNKEGILIIEQTAALIDGDRFEALSRSLDENDPFYEEIRLELYRRWSYSSILYLFTVAPGGETGYRYIIDGSGQPGSEFFSPLGYPVYEEDLDRAFFLTWQTRSRQIGNLERSDWGYLITMYEPIFNSRGEMVGVIGLDFDAEILYYALRELIIEQVVFAVFFAFAGLAVMFLLLRLIFTRLNEISVILKVLARGEGNLSERIAIKRYDEIGSMASLFNETLDKICKMVTLVKDQSVNLSNVGSELSENMNATASAVTEISENIQKIKSQAINQSASVTETNASMEQVMDNISRLNTQVEAQTESVSQSSSAIEEMLANIQTVTATLIKNTENVDKLISASDTGRTSLEEVARDIKGIAKESEGLLEINAVMENIASQTNLLSMNAAIEAAHAGEAGKGFAVVAGEIRKLAESSSKQSQTISVVLKRITDSINKITKSTSVVLDKFQDIDADVRVVSQQESNIRSAMEEQSAGSKQILEAISRLMEITRQVKDGSAEMLEGSREVIKEGKNLSAATEEINSSINGIASGADYINSAVERVHSLSNNNREHISALSREVGKFKVEAAEYVWDKTYAVGHDRIDDEHRQLFQAINNLLRNCKSGNRGEFDKCITFLGSYVEKHFSAEEEIQKSHNYPDYLNHKKIHDDFKAAAGRLSAKWLAAGPSESVFREVHSHIGEWLINHIKAQDFRIGAFIRSRKT